MNGFLRTLVDSRREMGRDRLLALAVVGESSAIDFDLKRKLRAELAGDESDSHWGRCGLLEGMADGGEACAGVDGRLVETWDGTVPGSPAWALIGPSPRLDG